MNFFTKSTLLMVGAGFLMTPAFAANVSQNSVYISGDAGFGLLATPDGYLADPDGIEVTKASYSRGGFAGGVNIGYLHALNQNVLLGAEFGYDYNGQSKYSETEYGVKSDLKITSQDLHLLATGTYLFNNGFNVFAKAGAARVSQKAEGSINGSSGNDTVNGYKPMAAGGVGYQYKLANFFVQYSHIFATDGTDSFKDLTDSKDNQKIATVDTIKAGVALNFSL